MEVIHRNSSIVCTLACTYIYAFKLLFIAISVFSSRRHRQSHCHATIMPLPCHCHATAMPLPCHYHATAMPLPCHCHATAIPLPCHCHATAMQLPCYCHAIAMSLPCHCCSSASHGCCLSFIRGRTTSARGDKLSY